MAGILIYIDCTYRIFTSPKDSSTEDYITGKFG
jgi:ABC-type phosphate transport system ATPase subunit